MSRLLVSVRDAVEARVAYDAGADLIDLKEPSRGALGSVAPAIVRDVVELLAGRVPVSAALGELRDASSDAAALPSGLAFAKVGLAGCANVRDWPQRWEQLLRMLPEGTVPVAVVYADWQGAEAPPPGDVLAAAIDLGCRALLVDTFRKDGRTLLDHWPPSDLARLVDDIRAAGSLVVLGGSLSLNSIPQVLPLQPDYIAVRGAACVGPRTDAIDAARVRDLVTLLRSARDRGSRC